MSAPQAPDIAGLRYVRLIGAGGYSTVYLYERESPRMEVVVKVLNADAVTGDTGALLSEADAMAQLSQHPYIAQVQGAGVASGGRPYIVMKYYPGQSYELRVKSAHFAVAEVLRHGVQIACAVETAHKAGILHRDIKPANILTDQYGNPALTDFGISAVASDQTSDSRDDGMSLPWAPREVVYGTSRPDERSDVYSLGATFWHLLVGRSPFQAPPGSDNSALALMRRIDVGGPPITGRGDVPVSLERLLAACMAKSPDDRPASALEVARALQSIEQELHLAVTPLTLATDERVVQSSEGAGADRTRIRAPQAVIAQPSTPETHRRPRQIQSDEPARRSEPADTPPRERVRVLPEPRLAAGTVRRPAAVSPDERPGSAAEEPAARATPPRYVAAAVIALVVVGGGIVALVSGLAPSSSPSTTTTGSVPQCVGGGTCTPVTPGKPVVRYSIEHHGTAVVFRWSYRHARPSDWYALTQTVGRVRSTPSVYTRTRTVERKRGQRVCLSVQVHRHDGSSPSPSSNQKCLA